MDASKEMWRLRFSGWNEGVYSVIRAQWEREKVHDDLVYHVLDGLSVYAGGSIVGMVRVFADGVDQEVIAVIAFKEEAPAF